MMMTKREIKKLLRRYTSGAASRSERDAVESWYTSVEYDNRLQVQEYEQAKESVWNNINPHQRSRRRFLRYAGIFIMLCSISLLYYSIYRDNTVDTLAETSEITPGGNRAVLVLGSKDSVNLSQLTTGDIIRHEGIKIEKLSDGTISYETDSTTNDIASINKLIVPRGGQYRIVLSDGSIVSINSESTIEFPSQFTGNERRIKMLGEGYFEVAKNKNKPFIVESKGQKVTVLGTKFNIKAYPNDTHTLTTLLEGKVEVSFSKGNAILLPGDQSIFDGKNIKILSAKTASEISWKDELFVFDSEPLESIMQKIARWYDVDIVFDNRELEKKQFTGTISKHNQIGQVLNLLEMTGKVKFTIRNKTIYIQKNN
ncbi:FecR family protein [Sphingobacterium tabacisoli]|uniref:FecR family protein n=1 Tax=Sphingobacterium tabacisoli TaxID=2044855 RepID=A0ABW5L6U3_9SPHI|nr:FecR family protein [Sphingobacterium tabacisoli]